MELRQLRQFVAVAEHLNFRRAAEQLHMAQPPLSVAIRNLENELGADLFVRQGRGIELTEAGHAALQAARRCLDGAKDIASVVRQATDGATGQLRMGFVGSAMFSVMPRLLPAFRKRYPGVQLVLRETTNLQALRQLETRDIDIALVRYPTTHLGTLTYELVERDTLWAALPADHGLARKRKLTLAQLAQEPLIDYATTQVPGLHALVAFAFQQAGLSPQVVQEAIQVHTVLSLVQSGLGVALVPSVAQQLAPRGVHFRPVTDIPPTPVMGIAMAFQASHAPATVARLREVAAECWHP
ncbi:MAG: LysR family transcriptional regulator [Burkholderiaceae bacterium]|nr:LysR family transcriptional regulator [Burkholderiaceae bacterium]